MLASFSYLQLHLFHTSPSLRRFGKPGKPELKMSDAQHKPRISGMSFGLLISELNSDNLTESAKAFRRPQSIPDSERATLRSIAKWALGLPVLVACLGVIGVRMSR